MQVRQFSKDAGRFRGEGVGCGVGSPMIWTRLERKRKKGVLARSLGSSEGGTNVIIKKDDGDAYKAVKRYLNKGEGHGAVLEDALVINSKSHSLPSFGHGECCHQIDSCIHPP